MIAREVMTLHNTPAVQQGNEILHALHSISSRLDGMDHEMGRKFRFMKEQMTDHSQRSRDRAELMLQRSCDTNAGFDRIESKLDCIQSEFKREFYGMDDKMNTKFDKFEARLDELENEFHALKHRFSVSEAKFKARVDELEGKVNKLKNTSDASETGSASLESRFGVKYVPRKPIHILQFYRSILNLVAAPRQKKLLGSRIET